MSELDIAILILSVLGTIIWKVGSLWLYSNEKVKFKTIMIFNLFFFFLGAIALSIICFPFNIPVPQEFIWIIVLPGTIMWLCIISIAVIYSKGEPTVEAKITHIYSKRIDATRPATNISGSGGLFYVSIKQENFYSVLATTDDGGYKKESFLVESTTIYETDDETPHIEKWEKCLTVRFPDSLLTPKDYEAVGRDTNHHTFYKIFIPKGSIVQEFSFMN